MSSMMRKHLAGVLVSGFALAATASAEAQVVRAWGGNGLGQSEVPTDLGDVVALACGGGHAIALRADGTLRCWGFNYWGQCNVPSDLGAVTAIVGGDVHTIALRADGTVRCWGYNGDGRCNVPSDLGPATAIAGGAGHTIALRADGTVRCWGSNFDGQCNVPSDLGPSIAIAGGWRHTIALRTDGSVRCWGANDYGQCNVPSDLGPATAIAGGYYHTIALRADGSVRCWGDNGDGQCTVPSDLGRAIAIAGGGANSFALTCAGPSIHRNSGNLGPIGSGTPREFTFSGLPAAASAATLRVRVRSDLNLSSEFLTLRLDGVAVTTLFVTGANDCPATPDEATVTIPLKALAGYLANGALTVRLEASPLVSATQCSDGLCEVSLSYEVAPVDCNSNGIEDTCEIRMPGRDCNGNGIPDSCDIASGTSADINGNGIPDSCEPDCNANNLPDSWEISQGLAPDCNTNGVPDSCDIASGTAADIDGNGVPDSCQGDCNGNGIPDAYEIVTAPWKDCDSDLVLDSCEIAANPALDCTGNGRLDSCDIATANGDCNGNGTPDSCEIANGAQDKDGDGVLDDCEFARGDFDLDGEIGGGDLAVVLALWGLQNPPIGDVSGDGVVSGEDLAMILANWGVIAWQPSIASVTPAVGGTVGGETITLRGSGFDSSTTVTIGGAAATSVTVVNATTLTAVTPAGSAGPRDVVVATFGGSATAERGFQYVQVTVPSWATLIEPLPDPAVVTNASLRTAIVATGYAWRVRDNISQIELLLVPPGTFDMGCSPSNQFSCGFGENPVHAVTLTTAFYIGRYEVTQTQWAGRMGENPAYFQSASTQVPLAQVANRPVERVSRNMIQTFLVSTGLRLPTEAEWEYSYRAGTSTAFHSMPAFPSGTSDDTQIGNIAWIAENSSGQTRPVGQRSANALGLYDMSGNVWEQVQDRYASEYYAVSPQFDPPGPESGTGHVIRGGGWDSTAFPARASFRGNILPDYIGLNMGFRVARNP